MLEPFGLLVDLVPRDAEDVGEEPLDQAVAAHDLPGLLASALRELERLVVAAAHVAVALEAADHLVNGRRGELHRPRDVRAGDREPRLLQPEHRLEVLLLGDRGVIRGHATSLEGLEGLTRARPRWI